MDSNQTFQQGLAHFLAKTHNILHHCIERRYFLMSIKSRICWRALFFQISVSHWLAFWFFLGTVGTFPYSGQVSVINKKFWQLTSPEFYMKDTPKNWYSMSKRMYHINHRKGLERWIWIDQYFFEFTVLWQSIVESSTAIRFEIWL
jgi:hypothetical protein